jgi:hypothetical protein
MYSIRRPNVSGNELLKPNENIGERFAQIAAESSSISDDYYASDDRAPQC